MGSRSGQLFEPVDDLFESQSIGEDFDGVGGRHQRPDLSRRIFTVAAFLGGQHLFERDGLAFRLQVVEPTPRPFRRSGRQEYLQLGLGKRHGALIASFGHDVVIIGQPALKLDEKRADLRIAGRITGYARHLRRPHRLADVFAIQQYPFAERPDVEFSREPGQVVGHVPVESSPKAGQGNCPIHGSRVEETKPEPLSQRPSDGALSSSSRSVDGDDHGQTN